MTPEDLPIYVISLARAQDRRERVRAQFEKCGLAYRIFDGVDGRANEADLLQKTDIAAWTRNMGAPVNAGHLGCYASHVALWEAVGRGPDEVVLICEDDVVLHDDFREALAAALSCRDGWDICRFAKVRAKGAVTQRTIGPYRLNAYWGPFTGNACYLIRKDVAARLATGFWPISRAHDHELNRFFVHDLRLMGLEPFAAHAEDRGESFITGRAMSDSAKFPFWRRLPYYAQKAANYVRRLLWLARHGMLGTPRGG